MIDFLVWVEIVIGVLKYYLYLVVYGDVGMVMGENWLVVECDFVVLDFFKV